MPWSAEYAAGMEETAAALREIARQLRIRNLIELHRLSGQSAWTHADLVDSRNQLHLNPEEIYPPEQKANE